MPEAFLFSGNLLHCAGTVCSMLLIDMIQMMLGRGKKFTTIEMKELQDGWTDRQKHKKKKTKVMDSGSWPFNSGSIL